MITDEEFYQEMVGAWEGRDEEDGHMHADALMIDILRSFGLLKGCDYFMDQSKWYA